MSAYLHVMVRAGGNRDGKGKAKIHCQAAWDDVMKVLSIMQNIKGRGWFGLMGGADEPSKQHETGNPRGPHWMLTSLRKLFKFNEEFGMYMEFGLRRKKK